jgi:hypothetical protein
MIIDAPDDESWVDMMVDMNNLKISMATDADQLKSSTSRPKSNFRPKLTQARTFFAGQAPAHGS